jgi:hypothetical protein
MKNLPRSLLKSSRPVGPFVYCGHEKASDYGGPKERISLRRDYRPRGVDFTKDRVLLDFTIATDDGPFAIVRPAQRQQAAG